MAENARYSATKAKAERKPAGTPPREAPAVVDSEVVTDGFPAYPFCSPVPTIPFDGGLTEVASDLQPISFPHPMIRIREVLREQEEAVGRKPAGSLQVVGARGVGR